MAAKEKKEKKEKHSKKDGVSKSKKEKKTNSEAFVEALADAVDQDMADASDGVEVKMAPVTVPVPLVKAALVPFANPLVEDKTGKKVLKGVKKSAKTKTLKRGVKEVVKALRKSEASGAGASAGGDAQPHFVCVLAADISPMDVISHIPVLCEDHGVPYVYVTSRAELGAAGMTKRPTSVVLVGRDVAGKAAQKSAEAEGRSLEQVKEEWDEAYGDLVKVMKKAGKDVRI